MALPPIDDDENALPSAALPSRDREGAVARFSETTAPSRLLLRSDLCLSFAQNLPPATLILYDPG